MTTTTTTCACGETQPHHPTRYIAPGVDGIDSTARTCAGIQSEAQGSLGAMTTATETASITAADIDRLIDGTNWEDLISRVLTANVAAIVRERRPDIALIRALADALGTHGTQDLLGRPEHLAADYFAFDSFNQLGDPR